MSVPQAGFLYLFTFKQLKSKCTKMIITSWLKNQANSQTNPCYVGVLCAIVFLEKDKEPSGYSYLLPFEGIFRGKSI
jgi:hypothetical protein